MRLTKLRASVWLTAKEIQRLVRFPTFVIFLIHSLPCRGLMNYLRRRLFPPGSSRPPPHLESDFWFFSEIQQMVKMTLCLERLPTQTLSKRRSDIARHSDRILAIANSHFDSHGWYPLSLSFPYPMPPENLLASKTQLVSKIVPWTTYSYSSQSSYNLEYKTSFFGITGAKANWDSFRNLEMLYHGCLPLHMDLPGIPKAALLHYPLQEMNEILEKFREEPFLPAETMREFFMLHFNKFLTCESMMRYALEISENSYATSVLFIDESLSSSNVDYCSIMAVYGLHAIFRDQFASLISLPSFVYESYVGKPDGLYGRGFNYTGVLQSRIESFFERSQLDSFKRIDLRKVCNSFDLVVLGSISRNADTYRLLMSLDVPVIALWGEDYLPPRRVIRENPRIASNVSRFILGSL